VREVLVLLALVAAPAAAQEDRCQAEWDRIGGLLAQQFGARIGAERVIADGRDCVAMSVTQPGRDRAVPSAREVRWQAMGEDAFAGVLPERISLQAFKLAMVPVFDHSPALSWVYKVQSLRTGVDLALDITLDVEAGVIDLKRLRLDFVGDNRIELEARLVGADLSDARALQDNAGEMALHSTRLRLESHGLFESLVLPTLGPVLFDTAEDPEAELARLQALAAGWLARLPGDLLAGESRDALVRLVGTLPHPNGVLEIRMEADPPLGARRGLDLEMDPGFDPVRDVARLVEGVALDVTYDHTPFAP